MAAAERGGATYTPDDLLRFVLSAAKPAVPSDETKLQTVPFNTRKRIRSQSDFTLVISK